MTRKTQTHITFTADKNGKPIAYREGYNLRYFRIGYDEAKLMIATGQAIEIPFVNWNNR